MSSKQTWALALSSIGSFMVALDALVVTTALSTIRLRLGASIEQLEWTVNAYTLSFAVLLMTGSALGDRFGRRRMFVVGLAIFALASAACALSPNIVWLIVARAIQGTGAALVMPLAVTLLSAAIPPEHRGRAFGLFSGTAGLAVLSGPVVGGAIAQGIAWQWIFWLNVPIGLATIPFVLGRIEESYGPRTPLDIRGMLLLSGAVLGIVWGLVRGNIAGWGSTEVIAAIAAGVLLAVGFVFWELRARAPMLPMRLFRSRVFTAGNAAGFLFFASLYGSAFFLAQFLQTVQGASPFGAGLRLLPWTVVLFATAPISGALINRFGERYLMVVAMLLQGIAMAWIGLVARPGVAYSALIVPLIVAGFGAAAIPTAQNAVISSVAPSAIGKASGTFSMLRQLGGAFGVAILAAVFSHAGSFHSAQAFSDGFSPAMVVSAAFSLLGVFAGLLLPRRRSAVVEVVDTPTQFAPLAESVGMGAGGN
ncbi:MAG TPA: DHA2 family efflux MFS transporter permease subunit [Ktedonobacterales bacterium]|nr:DHA2 family efflux MFS transporter permease subunit [Ktedonobacterales bacterium]